MIFEQVFSRKEKDLQTAVATLLLITASVLLACVVVDFAVSAVENTLNTTNLPQLDRIKNMENNLLNQTYSFNGTQLPLQSAPPEP